MSRTTSLATSVSTSPAAPVRASDGGSRDVQRALGAAAGGGYEVQRQALTPAAHAPQAASAGPDLGRLGRVQSALTGDGAHAEAPNAAGPAATHRNANDPVSADADERAATLSPQWQALSPGVRTQLEQELRSGNAQAALMTLARGAGMDLSRVTLEVTPNLGTIHGESVGRADTDDGLTIPYVNRGATSAADIRCYIQLIPRLFAGPLPPGAPPDRLIARLHSTLMHEYTHAQQAFASPLPTHRIPHGAIETFAAEGGERDGFLDEIDATASEIENMTVTGLAQMPEMRGALGYLYSHYRDANRSRAPGPAVAQRVLRAMLAGRRALAAFIASPEFPRYLAAERPIGGLAYNANYFLFNPADAFTNGGLEAMAGYVQEPGLVAQAQAQLASEHALIARLGRAPAAQPASQPGPQPGPR